MARRASGRGEGGRKVTRTAPARSEAIRAGFGLAGGDRVEHARRTREGLARAKAAGKTTHRPSTVPQGVIDIIVSQRAKGNSYRLIAADLDAAHVPTPGGAVRWRAATVQDIYNRNRPE